MAMTTKQAAEKWGISDRRVRTLCVNGQIDGAWREGKLWFIPDNVSKPADGRIRGKETLLAQIERKKKELDGCRPLTEGEGAFTTRKSENFRGRYQTVKDAETPMFTRVFGVFYIRTSKILVAKGLSISKRISKKFLEIFLEMHTRLCGSF